MLNPHLNAEARSFIAHNSFILIEKREKNKNKSVPNPSGRKGLLAGYGKFFAGNNSRRGNAFDLEVSRALCCNYGAAWRSDVKPAAGRGGSRWPLASCVWGGGSH